MYTYNTFLLTTHVTKVQVHQFRQLQNGLYFLTLQIVKVKDFFTSYKYILMEKYAKNKSVKVYSKVRYTWKIVFKFRTPVMSVFCIFKPEQFYEII